MIVKCFTALFSLVLLQPRPANAGPFTFTFAPGGGTYTYDSLLVSPGPSFTENPNPYADLNGVAYNFELPPGGPNSPFAYYARNDRESPLPVPPTFSITLHAAAGQSFTSGSATSRLTVYTYGSTVSGGRIDETLSTDVSPNPVTLATVIGQPGHVTDETYNPVALPIAGATAFTLTFSISGRVDGDVRLFQEFYGEAPAMPLVISAISSAPEPSALAVVALGALATGVARRRPRLRHLRCRDAALRST
jgi:hypothetical protein